MTATAVHGSPEGVSGHLENARAADPVSADSGAESRTAAADDIVAVARRAQQTWAARGVRSRASLLSRLAGRIAQRTDEIAAVIHEENGKPLTEAVGHEVVGSVQLVNHHCAVAADVLDRRVVKLPMSPHRKPTLTRRPYGVVLGIAPWNLPWIIPFSQVLPALLAGNAAILKPSELTPRTALLLADLLAESGLPEGLFQVVTGDGTVGAELIRARPDKVLFTGSVATGRAVMGACAQFPIPVALELGGVDVMIVRADADLEFASSAIAWGGTFNGGQSCCSVERVLVHSSIADRLRVRVVDKLSRIHPEVELAPAIDDRQLETWHRHLADAASRELRIEPDPEAQPPRLITPRLVTGEGVTDAAVWHEETFGPLIAMREFRDDDEAVAWHNASRFGLTASIITSDRAAGAALARRLRAGSVAINDVAATMYGSPELPWGGVGDSGFGRSHGEEGLLECSWAQVIEEPRGLTYGPKRPWWYPYDLEQSAALAALAAALGRPELGGRLLGMARTVPTLIAPLSRRPRR